MTSAKGSSANGGSVDVAARPTQLRLVNVAFSGGSGQATRSISTVACSRGVKVATRAITSTAFSAAPPSPPPRIGGTTVVTAGALVAAPSTRVESDGASPVQQRVRYFEATPPPPQPPPITRHGAHPRDPSQPPKLEVYRRHFPTAAGAAAAGAAPACAAADDGFGHRLEVGEVRGRPPLASPPCSYVAPRAGRDLEATRFSALKSCFEAWSGAKADSGDANTPSVNPPLAGRSAAANCESRESPVADGDGGRSASSSYVGCESVDGDLGGESDFSCESISSVGESLMAVSDFTQRPVGSLADDDEDDMTASESHRRRAAIAAGQGDGEDEYVGHDDDNDCDDASCGYFYDDEFEELRAHARAESFEAGDFRRLLEGVSHAELGRRTESDAKEATSEGDDEDDDPLRGYKSAFENVLQVSEHTPSCDGSSASCTSCSSDTYEADVDDDCAARLCAAGLSPDNYTLAFGAAAAALSGSSVTLEKALSESRQRQVAAAGGRPTNADVTIPPSEPRATSGRAAQAPGGYGHNCQRRAAAGGVTTVARACGESQSEKDGSTTAAVTSCQCAEANAAAEAAYAASLAAAIGPPTRARDDLRREALMRLRRHGLERASPAESTATEVVSTAAASANPRDTAEPGRRARDDVFNARERRGGCAERERSSGAAHGLGTEAAVRCCISLMDIVPPPPPPSPPPPPPALSPSDVSGQCRASRRRRSHASRLQEEAAGVRRPSGAARNSRSSALEEEADIKCGGGGVAAPIAAAELPELALPDVTFLKRDKKLICETSWWAHVNEEPAFCKAASETRQALVGGAASSPLCTYAVVYQSSFASERKCQMALVRRLLGDDVDGDSNELSCRMGGADSSSGIATGSSEVAAAIKDPRVCFHRTSPDGCHRRRSSDAVYTETKDVLAAYAYDDRFLGVTRCVDAIDELLALTHTRLTSEEAESRLVGALRNLSSTLESSLSAGIKASRVTVVAFGKFTSRADIWDVVEESAVTVCGEPTKHLTSVVAIVKGMEGTLLPGLRFCLFVCGLLNHRCLDFWLQVLRHNQQLLSKFYDDEALLRCSSAEQRAVYAALLGAIAKLSLCSFELDLELLRRRFSEAADPGGIRCLYQQPQQLHPTPGAQFYV